MVHGDGVVSEEKIGSGFLNFAMPNAAAGSQGAWLSVAPNVRITFVFVHNPKSSLQKIRDLGPDPTSVTR